MRIIKSVAEVKKALFEEQFLNKRSIGLVPTMGALHAGHLSLVQRSIDNQDFVVVSIFVNPTQFNDPKDFEKYPITIEQDLKLLEEAGCDLVFLPAKEEMYPNPSKITMDFGALGNVLEGEFRPGHFSGVGVVVSKLFNIINPDVAYFGQKDLQQFAIIQQLVSDLNFPIRLAMCPIERDENGLALSSRNARLSAEGIQEARKLNILLKQSIEAMQKTNDIGAIANLLIAFKEANKSIEIEYLKIVYTQDLTEVDELNNQKEKAICIAAFVEGVRLIDNMIFV